MGGRARSQKKNGVTDRFLAVGGGERKVLKGGAKLSGEGGGKKIALHRKDPCSQQQKQLPRAERVVGGTKKSPRKASGKTSRLIKEGGASEAGLLGH